MFNRRGAGNYAYTSARVKAKKANLLKKDDYDKMLVMTVPEISHYISEAGYSKEMAELGARYSGISLLEYATYANMSKAFRSILSSATGELSNMVYAYLTKWDFANLKVILRGKNYGSSVEEIREDLVPAGLLKMEDLDRMISSSNMEDVLTMFKAKTNLVVSESAVSVYKQDGILAAIEDELTKSYYKNLLAATKGNDRPANIFRTYVKHVIDSKNIEVALKMKVENIAAEAIMPFFIPGGSEVDEKIFSQVANAADLTAALNELQQLRIYADIKELLVSEPTVVDIVGAIEQYKVKLANDVAAMYPLSVIPVVNYMIHKEIEVRNIRMIAHGIDSGLDRETMKSLLVI